MLIVLSLIMSIPFMWWLAGAWDRYITDTQFKIALYYVWLMCALFLGQGLVEFSDGVIWLYAIYAALYVSIFGGLFFLISIQK